MLDNRQEKRATDEFSRLAQKIAQDFPNMKSFIVLEDSTEEATVQNVYCVEMELEESPIFCLMKIQKRTCTN